MIELGQIFKGIISHNGILLLTKLHADVFVRVLLPELLILIFITHEREDDLLANGLEKIKVLVRTAIGLQRLNELKHGAKQHPISNVNI